MKKEHLAAGAVALSTLACSPSDILFSPDPGISALRGAVSAATLGFELFPDALGKVLTKNSTNPPGCFLLAGVMLAVPIAAGILSAEYSWVGYTLMAIAILGPIIHMGSRR